MSNDVADERSLLEAVLREPEADEPRLHYADWLRRTPQPANHARAEFIRLQIELARVTHDDPQWASKLGRQRELLTEHRNGWERPLRQRLRPKLSAPAKWLKAQLFGSGGVWGYRRGFVEQILTPAERFLTEDRLLVQHTPIRRVALTHVSESIAELSKEPTLARLDSLHLIGDMELDEELTFLSIGAKQAGLTVLEFRFPRLREVFVESHPSDLFHPEAPGQPVTNTQWMRMASGPRERLNRLLQAPALRVLIDEPAPEHTAAVLALSDWVFMGTAFQEAQVWAVAKGYHDTPDDEGRCRRLVLLRGPVPAALRASPYFHSEVH